MKWWYANEEEQMEFDNVERKESCLTCSRKDKTCRPIGYSDKTSCMDYEPKERDMEFDKSRVYTALNADELKQGDKVIVGSSLLELKTNVECNRRCGNIVEIGGECSNRRFTVDDVDGRGQTYWELAYLVERVENCTNCEHQGEYLCSGVKKAGKDERVHRCEDYVPKTTDEIRALGYVPSEICINCKEYSVGYCNKHNRKTRYDYSCNDWELYKPKTTEKPDLVSLGNGQYAERKHYRPFRDTDELIKVWTEKGGKWQKRELTMPYIWVRRKEGNIKGQLITEFSNSLWVEMGKEGYNMTDLLVHFEFLDGTPCGVEE